jgi:hypothetical protein
MAILRDVEEIIQLFLFDLRYGNEETAPPTVSFRDLDLR